jgi:hypothetical protein
LTAAASRGDTHPVQDSASILPFLVFIAWSVLVSVAAHRRVRNVILASAGAAGVATGGFVLAGALAAGHLDPMLVVVAVFGLAISLVVALLTWVAMKLGGWLPRWEEEGP